MAAACLAFAATFGLGFGFGSQTCYFVPSLRILDSTLFVNDWYAMRTTHYHPAFAYLGVLLLGIDPQGRAVALALTVAITAAAAWLYTLSRATAGERLALPVFLVLLTFAALTRTRGPMGTYVFDAVFQPSTVASAAFVAAVAAFVRGRFLLSGFFAAVSTLFHLNLAPFVITAFGLAHVRMGRRTLRRRLLEQLALPAVVMVGFLPLLARTMVVEPGTEWAREVYLYVRAPHHYDVAAHAKDFLPFVAWQLIGFGAAWPLMEQPGMEPLGRLTKLSAALCFVIWTGVALALVSPSLAISFSWRLAAHAELLLAAVAITALVRFIAASEWQSQNQPAAVPIIVSGLLVGAIGYGMRGRFGKALVVVTAGVLAVVVVRRFAGAARTDARLQGLRRALAGPPSGWLSLGGALLLAAACWEPLGHFDRGSMLIRGRARDEMSLYAWMRDATPKDAVFLTPPEIDGFRLHARRAIVGDWRGTPGKLGEVVEWYRRMEAVTGHPGLRGRADLSGYAALDPRRLETLRKRYGIGYAVVQREHAARLAGYPREFENPSFVVFRAEPIVEARVY